MRSIYIVGLRSITVGFVLAVVITVTVQGHFLWFPA